MAWKIRQWNLIGVNKHEIYFAYLILREYKLS